MPGYPKHWPRGWFAIHPSGKLVGEIMDKRQQHQRQVFDRHGLKRKKPVKWEQVKRIAKPENPRVIGALNYPMAHRFLTSFRNDRVRSAAN